MKEVDNQSYKPPVFVMEFQEEAEFSLNYRKLKTLWKMYTYKKTASLLWDLVTNIEGFEIRVDIFPDSG